VIFMRKTVILLVVALLMAAVFLFPLFTERTYSVQFSIPPDKIIVDSQPPTQEEIESISVHSFENMHFETVIVQNANLYGCRWENIGIINPSEINTIRQMKWYKTTLSVGYFRQINGVKIYSPKQILFATGGNPWSFFWAIISLAVGMVMIFSISIRESEKV